MADTNDDPQEKERVETCLNQNFPLYQIFDLDRSYAKLALSLWRLYFILATTKMLVHPDELFQGTQIAYDMVYGGVDLPWEWRYPYRIRNALYPIYLSWPLRILKYFRIDFQPLVLASPYIAHFPLLIASDLSLWKIGKKVVGKPATRIAFIMMLTNHWMVELMCRCFTNTCEMVCTVCAFVFYMRQKDKFTGSTAAFTSILVAGFVMRSTTPVGWIPLLLLKMIKDNALIPFLIAGIAVAVPLIGICIFIDSSYYQQAGQTQDGKFEIILSSYNFLKLNVLEGLSKYFGDHRFGEYVFNFFPIDIFKFVYPFVLLGLFNFTKDTIDKR